jgi:hypothetical protein
MVLSMVIFAVLMEIIAFFSRPAISIVTAQDFHNTLILTNIGVGFISFLDGNRDLGE